MTAQIIPFAPYLAAKRVSMGIEPAEPWPAPTEEDIRAMAKLFGIPVTAGEAEVVYEP